MNDQAILELTSEAHEIITNINMAARNREITDQKRNELLRLVLADVASQMEIQPIDNWDMWVEIHKAASIERALPKHFSYHEYIQSPQWKKKAERAKQAAGYRCQVCNRHRDEVQLDAHHRTYERLGREILGDITVLCRDCHELYEANK